MPHSKDSASSATSTKLVKAKILMLHGHTQSGSCFHAKTRRLENCLQSAFPASPSSKSHPEFPGGVELFYPTGPLRLVPADVIREVGSIETDVSLTKENQAVDAWAWGAGDFRKANKIDGLSQSVTEMLGYMQRHGPFLGVIGFSCGATLGAILASLLEGGRSVKGFEFPENFNHPPLRFAVCYSGFILHFPAYKPCYHPKIRTPIITIIGRYDPMTEESQTLLLAKRCKNSMLLYHPGGHHVPLQTYFLIRVLQFIGLTLGRVESKEENGKKDNDWIDI